MLVSISGLDTALVLAALFNAASQHGAGFADARGAEQMTREQAQAVLDDEGPRFDYLWGRPLKVTLEDGADTLDAAQYDSRNGEDAALMAIVSLRKTGDPNSELIQYLHAENTYQALKKLERSLSVETGSSPDGMSLVMGLSDMADKLGPVVEKFKRDQPRMGDQRRE